MARNKRIILDHKLKEENRELFKQLPEFCDVGFTFVKAARGMYYSVRVIEAMYPHSNNTVEVVLNEVVHRVDGNKSVLRRFYHLPFEDMRTNGIAKTVWNVLGRKTTEKNFEKTVREAEAYSKRPKKPIATAA